MIWFIGDVHGYVASYEKICARLRKEDPEAVTIQVGDMGLGFRGVKMPEVGPNDFFISGNHDDALICQKSPGYLGDYGVREFCGKKVFWVSGAMSTDKWSRVEGETWWAYEELTYEQLTEAVKLYEEVRPDIVVTHDCPAEIRQKWFGYRDAGRTVQALTQMWNAHQPEIWAFGHHHWQRQDYFHGTLGITYFMCLGELQNKLCRTPTVEDVDDSATGT